MDLFQVKILHTRKVLSFSGLSCYFWVSFRKERVLGGYAHTDPSTHEFSKVYLTPLNIKIDARHQFVFMENGRSSAMKQLVNFMEIGLGELNFFGFSC